MQELYDKRVLHRILGVEPRNSIVHHAEVRRRTPTSPRHSRVVESAWTNKQLKDETDYEDDHHRRNPNSYDQEGGRYDIGRSSSKKRRRAQRSDDHPVYFVADGDSRGDLSEGEVEGDEEAGEVHEDDGRGSRENGGISRHTRRKFWLGKAIEIGLAEHHE